MYRYTPSLGYIGIRPLVKSAYQKINFLISHSQPKIVSEYDQEIPQSQTADNLVAPPGRAAQPSRDTRKTN